MTSLTIRQEPEVALPTSTENECDDNNEISDIAFYNKYSDCEEYPSLVSMYMKMVNLFKEICLMLLLCAAYAALTTDPPKISKSPPAFPFFPKDSIVSDWYRGEISAAINQATDSDIGFVMFYAPWDAESREIRTEFELAAKHMHKLIAFSAVNCWQPGSECKNKYSKVYSWPVLLAYTTHGRVVQYNGPKTAGHMIKFLQNVIHPFKRINNIHEIYNIQAEHDAVIVATVDTRPGSAEFAAVYTTALKLLEKDPFSEIAFVVQSRAQTEKSFLMFHLWNETLIYPEEHEFKSDQMINWLTKHLHQLTIWVAPSGVKSQQLSTYLQGPTLILFTPQNPLLESMDYYILLKEVAREYYNCDNNVLVQSNTILTNLYRQVLKYNFEELLNKCSDTKTKQEFHFPKTVTYSGSAFWANNTCHNLPIGSKEKCFFQQKLPKQCLKDTDDCIKIYHGPASSQRKHFTNENCKVDKNDINLFKTSMTLDVNDPKSPNQLLKTWKENECKSAQLAKHLFPILYSLNDSNDLNVTGLSCKTNNTLTLIALDSLKYHHFAERFGIDILKQKNKTALLIINDKDETHYIFDGYLTDRKLREFIINYTQSNLPRALLSTSVKFKYTHQYPKHKDCNSKNYCILDLNSNNFMETVMEDNKVVIVLYHSKQCSFCSGISYRFLMAAKALSIVKNIKFARIDGDLNTLPWQYTMNTYPTILFFPAKRKSESRAFPQLLPITVPNIISFVLTNLEPSLKLNAMWSICNHTKHVEDKKNCIAAVRTENLAVIEATLREWRKADPRAKPKILYRLQQLKSLHLQLVLSTNNSDYIKMYLEKLNKSSLETTLVNALKDHIQQWSDNI